MSAASQLPQQSQSTYPAAPGMAPPVPLQTSFAQRGAGGADLHEMENRKLRHRLSKLEREHEELKRVYLRLSLWTKERANITGQELYSFLQNTEVLPPHDHNDLGTEEDTAPDVTESGGGRFFEAVQDLEGSHGHQGPVYICSFSRRGNLLASGSFDKTVKVWRLEGGVSCETFQEHSLNVGDLSWSADDAFLVSGGYDKTIKCYDVQGVKALSSWEVSGFALSVAVNPLDENQIWAGTSQSMLHMIDRRSPALAVSIRNEQGTASMVNALDVPSGPGAGFKLFSGDSRGMVKVWDIRAVDPSNPVCEAAIRNGEGAKPISDLHLHAGPSAEEPSLLAVNSYDDVLRVYQRPSQPDTSQGAPPLRLLHSLLGHRNKNFPIRSHLFRGSRCTTRPPRPPASSLLQRRQRSLSPRCSPPLPFLPSLHCFGDSLALKTHCSEEVPFLRVALLPSSDSRSPTLPPCLLALRQTPLAPQLQASPSTTNSTRRGLLALASSFALLAAVAQLPRLPCPRASRGDLRVTLAVVGDGGQPASAGSGAEHGGARAGIERSMLLATGSADRSCYVYDIGGPQAELVQRLEGHGDRVYCARFHPAKPLLATASADHRIKLWAPSSR